MKKKLLVAIIFAITMSAPMLTGVNAFADTTNTVQSVSADKAQQEQKAQAVQEKMEKLDNQIQNTMSQSQTLNNKIAEANNNINSIQSQISDTQTKLDANKKKMSAEISGLYQQGFANDGLLAYLNVLFSGKSFSEIVSNIQDIYSINQSNQKVLKQIQDQENQLKSEKDSLQSNMNTLEQSKNQIATNLSTQQKAKQEEQGILSTIQNNIAQDSAKEIAMQKAEVQAALKADQAAAAKSSSSSSSHSSATASSSNSGSSSSSSSSNVASSSNSGSSNSNSGGTMTVSTGHGNVQESTSGNRQFVPNGAKASASAAAVIAEAEKFIGVPYVWGGESPSGFDCSGLMQYVFGAEGVSLPRTSEAQQNVGTPVARGDLQPGDLVFWGEPAYHVAMYIGNGQVIAAPYTGSSVRIQNIWPYTNARRVL